MTQQRKQNTAFIFLEIEGKQAYSKKNRDSLKCGVRFVTCLSHGPSCENRPETEEARAICYVTDGSGSNHEHKPPTRMEWIDTLLRWCIRIEIYSGLAVERAMREVYEAWPFVLTHNPKHLIASMAKAAATVKRNVHTREPS